MKMKSTILFLSIILSITTMAQNLSLSTDGGTLAPDETIYIWGDSGQYTTIYCYLHVTNNGASDMDVLVKKTEVSILSGTENSFCWGNCYMPSIFVSPTPVPIAAAQTDMSSFSGDYMPKGQAGLSTIRYTFFDKMNSNDSIAVNVVFGSGTASINSFETENTIAAYPNPATTHVNFTYQSTAAQNGELVILSAAGTEVYRSVISPNAPLNVDVRSFNAGLYFYSVQTNGQSDAVRKLIVMH